MIGDILQPTHLIFVLVVALLVLGPKRLPEAGRALGKGIRDFKSAIGGEEDRPSVIPTEAAPPPPEAVIAPEPASAVQTRPAASDAAGEPAEEPTETVHPVG
jgi:sec-independent protein translocase protein TatA